MPRKSDTTASRTIVTPTRRANNIRGSTSCIVFALRSNPSNLFLLPERCLALQQVPSTALLESMRNSGLLVLSILVVAGPSAGSSSMRLISWDCSRVFDSNDNGFAWFKGNEISMTTQGTTKKTVTLEYMMQFIEANPILPSARCLYKKPSSQAARHFFEALNQAFDPIRCTIDAQAVQLHTTSPVEFHYQPVSSPVDITTTPMLNEPTPKCPGGEMVLVPRLEIRSSFGSACITQLVEFSYGTGKPRPASPVSKRTSVANNKNHSKKNKKRKNSSEVEEAPVKKSRAPATSVQQPVETLILNMETDDISIQDAYVGFSGPESFFLSNLEEDYAAANNEDQASVASSFVESECNPSEVPLTSDQSISEVELDLTAPPELLGKCFFLSVTSDGFHQFDANVVSSPVCDPSSVCKSESSEWRNDMELYSSSLPCLHWSPEY